MSFEHPLLLVHFLNIYNYIEIHTHTWFSWYYFLSFAFVFLSSSSSFFFFEKREQRWMEVVGEMSQMREISIKPYYSA